ILHTLLKLLDVAPPAMSEAILEALSNLAYALNQDFKVFMPMVHAVMTKHSLRSQRYAIICHAILKGETPPLLPSTLTYNRHQSASHHHHYHHQQQGSTGTNASSSRLTGSTAPA